MKKTLLKNTLLIASGVMLATGFGILAAGASTSIEANITNLVQYLGALHITSDGTPSGTEVLSIDGSGAMTQIRDERMSVVNGVSMLGFPIVGSLATSGDLMYVNGIQDLTSISPSQPYQSILATFNQSNNNDAFMATRNGSATIGIYDDYTDATTLTQIDVQADSISFGFSGGVGYSFPSNAGSSGQVLQTDGAGTLTWANTAGGGEESVQTAHVTIESAEVITLANNPIMLVPAPAAGQFLDIVSINVRISNITTSYDFSSFVPGAAINVKFSSASTTLTPLLDSFCNSITDAFIKLNLGFGGLEIVAEDALVLTAGSIPTQGDGTLDVYITYKTIDL